MVLLLPLLIVMLQLMMIDLQILLAKKLSP